MKKLHRPNGIPFLSISISKLICIITLISISLYTIYNMVNTDTSMSPIDPSTYSTINVLNSLSVLNEYIPYSMLGDSMEDRLLQYQQNPIYLSSCTVQSELLGHRILQWIEDVQIPAYDAVDSISVPQNANTQYHGPTYNQLRDAGIELWIAEYKYGLADRYKHAFYNWLMAFALNKPYCLIMSNPVPLLTVMEPHLILWNCTAQSLTEAQANTLHQDNTIMFISTTFAESDDHRTINELNKLQHAWTQYRGVIYSHNYMKSHNTWNTPYITERLKDRGIHTPLQLDNLYTCWYNLMFQPTTAATQLLERSIHPIGYTIQWETAQQPSRPYIYRVNDFSKQKVPLLCLQYRMAASGDMANMSWTDVPYAKWARPEALDGIIHHTYTFAADALQLQTSDAAVWFVASDSRISLQHVEQYVTEQNLNMQVFTIHGSIAHIYHVNQELTTGYPKAVLDNWMLGLCDTATITESGYGQTGVWRAERTWLPYNRILVVQAGTGKLIQYKGK